MAETQKVVQNAEGKDVPKDTIAPAGVTGENQKVDTPSDSDHQFGEETTFTDTMTGTVVEAYSLAEAVEKINEKNKKDDK